MTFSVLLNNDCMFSQQTRRVCVGGSPQHGTSVKQSETDFECCKFGTAKRVKFGSRKSDKINENSLFQLKAS